MFSTLTRSARNAALTAAAVVAMLGGWFAVSGSSPGPIEADAFAAWMDAPAAPAVLEPTSTQLARR